MAHYKIKNITADLNKRHSRHSSELQIAYSDGFKPKNYNLKVNDELVISCSNIPVNLQILRTRGLITLTQISEKEYSKSISVKPTVETTEPVEKSTTKKVSTSTSTSKKTEKNKPTTTSPPEEEKISE